MPAEVKLVEADVGDETAIGRILADHEISHVMHFAASTVVPDSVADPLGYYRNNTIKTHALLAACLAHEIKGFVFSSTAAVYGAAAEKPINEQCADIALTKAIFWKILIDSAAAYGLPHVILRYFNVAGADPAGRAGQRTLNATHLVKVAAEAAAGLRDGLSIFGTDYPTPDGTCIRDYIHVSDETSAISALNHLLRQGPNLTLNCGYGRGYSVRDVIAAVEKDVGARLKVTESPRRPGDAAEVVADVTAIQQVLDWRPRYDDLSVIVSSAIRNERLRIRR